MAGVWLGASMTALAKLSPDKVAKLPPARAGTVDFVRDVKPIFDTACVKCHGKGKSKGGFSIETREVFFKGGDSGAPLVAGKSAESLLIELVAGFDPETVMPKKGSKLKPAQVATLRAWIDQGAKWPAEVKFQKSPINNLHPRRPGLPAMEPGRHPLDLLLEGYFRAHKIAPPKVVDDRAFARRAYLDVLGVLPAPKEMEEFLAIPPAGRREWLVTKLLADNKRYAEHWLTFWNDLLRNDYQGTGYIDGGRRQITTWLHSALHGNKPYDAFVRELVAPDVKSMGFVNGIVWRGEVNSSQKPVMQAAQNIGQVFLGVNLKCASCHDSFINDYTLADAYGLAAVYATNDLEMAECDKPTGQNAKVKFLYPELGDIDPALPREARMKRLAEILTSRQDGRVTRTMVNRLWARFLGHGLVEPVDEMDLPAWNADILDWLAEDLAENGYDLKRTMKWILTSRAYQLPAVNLADQQKKEFIFTGPALRRLGAEQFRDALGQLTGVWYSKAANLPASLQDNAPRAPRSARWIWSHAGADKKAPAQAIHLRKSFHLSIIPDNAHAVLACDNSFALSVNGSQIARGNDYKSPAFVDLKPHLKPGTNVISVVAVNHTPDNKPPAPGAAPNPADANPAGFIFAARLGAVTTQLSSDATWEWSANGTNGWQAAAEVAALEGGPWNLAAALDQRMGLTADHIVRASLVATDPLQTALGRPNREQVTTARQEAATTLQALELTNGETLNKLVKRGAEKLLKERKRAPDELVSELFVRALTRPPTANELQLAAELLGQPARAEGLEDLLWSLAMLPEFQLIY
jgi:mono/diheme cytochrome c family protein